MKNDYIKNPELLELFRKFMVRRNEGHMFVKKLKEDYKIYCSTCHEYHRVSKKIFNSIRKSHVCPFCFNDIRLHYKYLRCWDQALAREEDSAYWITMDWKFGFRVPHVKAIEVIKYEEGYVLKRYVYISTFNYYFDQTRSVFKKITNSRVPKWVEWLPTIDKDYVYKGPLIKTKKAYVTEAMQEFFNYKSDVDRFIKSNQIKLMKEGLFNKEQLFCLIAFDLKTSKEVYKYNRYYKNSLSSHTESWATDTGTRSYDICDKLRRLCQFNEKTHEIKQLNVHYLDYLYRKQISLDNYMDYAEQCYKLNFKLDKPNDFEHRHAILSTITAEKQNKENDNKIKKRYKKLVIHSYKKKEISIKPFADCSEIIYAGKFLHNCIASNYLKRYADGDTDLYHLDVNGVMTVAIEVRKNELRQAYADANRLPDPQHKKIIQNWIRSMKKKRRLKNA